MFDFSKLGSGKPDDRPVGLVTWTTWKVVENELVEDKKQVPTRFEIVESGGTKWLQLDRGPQSMPLEHVQKEIDRGGWWAQAGSKPIYHEACKHPDHPYECCGRTCEQPVAGWSYAGTSPAMFVEAEELTKILESLS